MHVCKMCRCAAVFVPAVNVTARPQNLALARIAALAPVVVVKAAIAAHHGLAGLVPDNDLHRALLALAGAVVVSARGAAELGRVPPSRDSTTVLIDEQNKSR